LEVFESQQKQATQVKEALFVSVQSMGQALVSQHNYLIKSFFFFFFFRKVQKRKLFSERKRERKFCTEGYTGKERNQSAWGSQRLDSINDILNTNICPELVNLFRATWWEFNDSSLSVVDQLFLPVKKVFHLKCNGLLAKEWYEGISKQWPKYQERSCTRFHIL
jgi:hypothetical protein